MSNSVAEHTTGPLTVATGLDFTDAGVVIAGGTSGVGLATAIAFAWAGAKNVVIVGRKVERGESAQAQIREQCPGSVPHFIAADVCDPVAAEAVARQAEQRLGRIDVLVNSVVASYQPVLLQDTPLDKIATILMEQAVGPLVMSGAVLPVMRRQKRGSIVNIASDAARVPTPGETVLGGAMAAIVMFSKTLALEAKRDGVRVNVITPSLIVNTGSYDRAMAGEFSKKIFDKITAKAHLGLTEPEDLANTIVFLSSPLARLITGQVISINGGISVA
ncbi:MAG: 3-oxoacyl-[acyl-carrier-protein] reductase FabG [Hydrocarboniphaga sp.]|uniref:SDR family NAD(P)-dependent oxidoreductase n=1 Tax=Hydrocarboniphaga sp. TaxID=2033016 RepID=UPI0026134EE5|nr:SDR family oxidoreductase [Hydrocarboniphaga sp.]MDB5971666.1 3-oxoacyl-[acyl-carrier-protein] reductase FabG [Hydrocarboniphaga sp.]